MLKLKIKWKIKDEKQINNKIQQKIETQRELLWNKKINNLFKENEWELISVKKIVFSTHLLKR